MRAMINFYHAGKSARAFLKIYASYLMYFV